MKIHQTAIIHPKAQLDKSVIVNPYALIGENVTIGEGSIVGAYCCIDGWTKIGSFNKIFSGAVIGTAPQDLKYKGERSFVELGNNNVIREYVTINPGTGPEEKTIIGNGNLFMTYSHIAHNCVVGNDTVIANCGTLAGHVIVEDRAIIGGLVAIHQFARVGRLSIIGGCSKVVQDVPPFSMCDGHPARIYNLNSIGLKRSGMSAKECLDLKRAFRIVFFSGLSFETSTAKIEEEFKDSEPVAYLLNFIKNSKRGLCRKCKKSD